MATLAVILLLVLACQVVFIIGAHVGEYKECREAHMRQEKCLRDY